MSKYTTGELAKLCCVSVRTVQYYDERELLIPSTLSEGGRRLYSDGDLQRLKIICFLRKIGLPIETIKELFSEENPHEVISLLLCEQEAQLRAQVQEGNEKLHLLQELQNELRGVEHFTVASIGGITQILEQKQRRKKMLHRMLAVGILMDVLEIGAIVFGIRTGIWWPIIPIGTAVIALGVWISHLYYKHTEFLCPQCHTVFCGKFKEMFFARHTPKTRKLSCPHCHHKGFCVELYTKGKERDAKSS